jgi:hypothetical protein
LFKAKLTLVFGNSLKIDGLELDLLEENFPISHFQNPKLTTTVSRLKPNNDQQTTHLCETNPIAIGCPLLKILYVLSR